MVAATFDHILVFDANAGRRQLIHETLDELGYRVSLVWNDGAARRLLAEEEIDLLIADVVRIGDAAHTLMNHATSIGIPSVLLSRSHVLRQVLTPDAPAFAENPFTLEQLSDEVARVLAVQHGPLHALRAHQGLSGE
jgi:DNA-binding NtrC family response regulator